MQTFSIEGENKKGKRRGRGEHQRWYIRRKGVTQQFMKGYIISAILLTLHNYWYDSKILLHVYYSFFESIIRGSMVIPKGVLQ